MRWKRLVGRLSRDSPTTFPGLLFEDAFLAAFDKPSGLPVAPGPREKSRATLIGLVRERFGQAMANVHRLDAAASGVVLCARTKPALDFLSGQFQSKSVRKTYLALVAVLPPERLAGAAGPVRDASGGLPSSFSVDLALGEDEQLPGRVRVFKKRGGKPSVSEFRVLESFGRFAWLECKPITGRMHQVRVHLAAAGAPVLNDAPYGDPSSRLLLSDMKRGYKGLKTEKPLLSRLALHAASLGFIHPGTLQPMDISAPLPHEFEVALKYLRKFAAGPAQAGGGA